MHCPGVGQDKHMQDSTSYDLPTSCRAQACTATAGTTTSTHKAARRTTYLLVADPKRALPWRWPGPAADGRMPPPTAKSGPAEGCCCDGTWTSKKRDFKIFNGNGFCPLRILCCSEARFTIYNTATTKTLLLTLRIHHLLLVLITHVLRGR